MNQQIFTEFAEVVKNENYDMVCWGFDPQDIPGRIAILRGDVELYMGNIQKIIPIMEAVKDVIHRRVINDNNRMFHYVIENLEGLVGITLYIHSRPTTAINAAE